MRICYVANSRFPSERAHMTQIVQMCNAFVEIGHEVELLVTDRKTDIPEDAEVFYGVALNFTVIRIPVPDIAGTSTRIPVLLRPLAFMVQRFLFSFRAARQIKKSHYDLLYGRDEWVLWLIAKRVCIPSVWESHEAKFSTAVRRLLPALKKIVAISEGIRDFYLKQGVPSNKILVAHDAVDSRFFEPHISNTEARSELGIHSDKPIVMYVGGLETWKGTGTLFEASTKGETFDTYIIGGKEAEIERYAKHYPGLHFLGQRPYRELPRIQQAADILVIPNTAKSSLAAEYTSPLKLFTYMTSKKPIVASRVPSITNVLSEEEAFFFVPDDPVSLHDAISQVFKEKNKASEKAEKAFIKSTSYTWKKRAEKILRSSI